MSSNTKGKNHMSNETLHILSPIHTYVKQQKMQNRPLKENPHSNYFSVVNKVR